MRAQLLPGSSDCTPRCFSSAPLAIFPACRDLCKNKLRNAVRDKKDQNVHDRTAWRARVGFAPDAFARRSRKRLLRSITPKPEPGTIHDPRVFLAANRAGKKTPGSRRAFVDS